MTIRHSMTKADYEALAAFRFAIRSFLAFSEDAAQQAGITPRQYQAMLVIKARQPAGISIQEIASEMLIKHHTAVGLIDRLAKLQLVNRSPDPDDRRRVQVVMTGKAERLLAGLASAHLAELKGIRPAFARLMKQLD